jgi:ABC-type Zn uptake system ZnuABC Zn-binding protein ZnuA
MRAKFLILSLAFLFVISACTSAAAGTVSPASGLPGVLATESFLGDIAQKVAGDQLTVEVLLPVLVDPHEYQPKPQDVTRLARSQVLIVNGLGYEAWLKSTLDSLGGDRRLIVATAGLTADPDPSGEHPEGDPHMWMAPLNVIQYAETIRDGLSQADPAGKSIYARNTDAYIVQLQNLDRWVRDQVALLPLSRRLLVTNHDALGYFAKAYDFKIIGAVIPSVTSDASPSAQQLAGLVDMIKTSGAPAIFLDIGENQNLARQIAAETGTRVITDLYVESLSGPDGPAPTYLDMIKHDVTTIINALK